MLSNFSPEAELSLLVVREIIGDNRQDRIIPDFAIEFEENGLTSCQDKAREQKNRRRIQCNTARTLLRAQRSHGKKLETFYRTSIANSGIKELLNTTRISWPGFTELIRYHELAGFAYLSLKGYGDTLPQEIREFLKQQYYHCLCRAEWFRQEFTRLTDVFARQGIDIVPIKGMGLLEEIYSGKPCRPMVDIDVLVREGTLDKAAGILQRLGYAQDLGGLKEEYWRRKQCHLSFSKRVNGNTILLEAHWALDFLRGRRKILPLLWERVREYPQGQGSVKLLSPEDTLFSLALHNRRFGKLLCLKYVCDLGLLLNKYKDEFDWNYVFREARRGRMRAAVFFALSQLRVLDFPLPPAIDKELDIPLWKQRLVNRFIIKNIFLPAEDFRKRYLAAHFLLYDNIWEPVKYILNIPREQFAKYYGLEPYAGKTVFLYHLRWLYILWKALFSLAHAKSPLTPLGQRGERETDGTSLLYPPCSSTIFLFQTSGFSMWPFLKSGTKLLVKKAAARDLRVGDIILYRRDGQTVCHRLVRRTYQYIDSNAKSPLYPPLKKGGEGGFRGSALYARGDNSASPAEYVGEELILGKAIGMLKKGRVCPLTGTRRYLINRGIVWCAPWVRRMAAILKMFHIGQAKMI